MKCDVCHDDFKAEQMQGTTCRWCEEKHRFSAFAAQHGLAGYPDPTGERYVYGVDGTCIGKKSECQEYMSLLWNALAKSQNRNDLVIDATN